MFWHFIYSVWFALACGHSQKMSQISVDTVKYIEVDAYNSLLTHSVCIHRIGLWIYLWTFNFRLRNTSLESYYCAFFSKHIVSHKTRDLAHIKFVHEGCIELYFMRKIFPEHMILKIKIKTHPWKLIQSILRNEFVYLKIIEYNHLFSTMFKTMQIYKTWMGEQWEPRGILIVEFPRGITLETDQQKIHLLGNHLEI